MALLEEWQKVAYNQHTDKRELQKFWQRYFLLEKGVYEKLLTNPDEKVEGTVKELAEKYDVYYRVHAQTFGWLNWAKNGQTAGTVGYAKRLEGIQIVLVPKGGKAPSATPLNDGRACIIK